MLVTLMVYVYPHTKTDTSSPSGGLMMQTDLKSISPCPCRATEKSITKV